jgi:hypothetical protein
MENLKEYKEINFDSVRTQQLREVVIPTMRIYELRFGDIFVLNGVAIKRTFKCRINKIKIGDKIDQYFLCMEKIKKKYWWQFWKPRYWGAKFMYLKEEN